MQLLIVCSLGECRGSAYGSSARPHQHDHALLLVQVLSQNGFEVQQRPDGQLQMTAVGVSKNITFGSGEVLELAGLLQDATASVKAGSKVSRLRPARQVR